MTSVALHCFAQSPGVQPPLVLALVSANFYALALARVASNTRVSHRSPSAGAATGTLLQVRARRTRTSELRVGGDAMSGREREAEREREREASAVNDGEACTFGVLGSRGRRGGAAVGGGWR